MFGAGRGKTKQVMKNKLLLVLSVICLTAQVTYSQDEKEANLRLKGVLIENDYHKKITWVKSKPIPLVQKDFTVSPYDCSHIQLYFGLYMEDSVQKITPIRIVNMYRSSNWIFFDEVSYLLGSRKDVRAGKGVVFKLFDDDTNTKVERGVAEKSDIAITNEISKFIQYIVDNPIVPMECKYINNRKSESYSLSVYSGTKKLKEHFSAFVEAYNQVTEKFSLENQLTK